MGAGVSYLVNKLLPNPTMITDRDEWKEENTLPCI